MLNNQVVINLESNRDLGTHILGIIVSTVVRDNGERLYYRKCPRISQALLLCKFKITLRFPFRLHFIFLKALVFLQCASHGGCKGDILPLKRRGSYVHFLGFL